MNLERIKELEQDVEELVPHDSISCTIDGEKYGFLEPLGYNFNNVFEWSPIMKEVFGYLKIDKLRSEYEEIKSKHELIKNHIDKYEKYLGPTLINILKLNLTRRLEEIKSIIKI